MIEYDKDGILVAPEEGQLLGPIMQYLKDRQSYLFRHDPEKEEDLTRYPISWVRVDGSHIIDEGWLQSVFHMRHPEGSETILCAILSQDRQRIITLQKIVYNPDRKEIDWDHLHCPYVIR